MMKMIKLVLIQILYISIFLLILCESQLQNYYFQGNELSEILKAASFQFTNNPMAQIRLFIFYSLLFTLISINMVVQVSDEYGLDSFIIYRFQNKKNYIEYELKKIVKKGIEQFILIFLSILLASLIFVFLIRNYNFSFTSFIMLFIFSVKYGCIYASMSILAKILLTRFNINVITVVILIIYIFIIMLDINFHFLDLIFFSNSMMGMIQNIICLIICSVIYYLILKYRKEIV